MPNYIHLIAYAPLVHWSHDANSVASARVTKAMHPLADVPRLRKAEAIYVWASRGSGGCEAWQYWHDVRKRVVEIKFVCRV
jgi:hypothetical protein